MDHFPQFQGFKLKKTKMKVFGVLYAFILLFHEPALKASHAYPSPNPEKACQFYASELEKTHQIPDKLLSAVSLTEAGRSTVKGLIAWPWTINVEGKGYYFSTKSAAIQAVRRYQSKGIKSIDVGCMQINLMHHPQAFTNLEKAFDPYTNVSYGAKFLKSLKDSHKNWHKAVAHYHSATPAHHIPYRQKVLKTWLEEKKKGGTSFLQTALWAPSKFYRRPVKFGNSRKARSSSSSSSAFAGVRRIQRSAMPSYRAPSKRLASFSHVTSPRKVTRPLPSPVLKISSPKKVPLRRAAK